MTAIAVQGKRVIVDLVPGRRVRDLLLIVAAVATVTTLAQITIHLPFTPVPLSLASFGVLVTGAMLGPFRGGVALATYLIAGVAGAPWFSDHRSGWEFASFGYVIGFVVAAVAVGELARRGYDRTPGRTAIMFAVGSMLIYAAGVPWLAAYLDIDIVAALRLGMWPFLIGDALKAATVALLLPTLWRLAAKR